VPPHARPREIPRLARSPATGSRDVGVLEGRTHRAAKRQGGRGASPTGAAKKNQGTKGRVIPEARDAAPPPPAHPPIQPPTPSPASADGQPVTPAPSPTARVTAAQPAASADAPAETIEPTAPTDSPEVVICEAPAPPVEPTVAPAPIHGKAELDLGAPPAHAHGGNGNPQPVTAQPVPPTPPPGVRPIRMWTRIH